MSTVETESILSSTVTSVSSVASEIKSQSLFDKVSEFVSSFKFKIVLLLIGLGALYFVRSKLIRKKEKLEQINKQVEEVTNNETEVDKEDDQNYKIVLDDQGNPVLLSMDDIRKLEERLQNEVDRMEQQKSTPANTPLQTIPEERQQPANPPPEYPVQPPQQTTQQTTPQQVTPQQTTPQQVPPPQTTPPQVTQPVTIETLNNLLSEESDIEEDLNVNEQNLTREEMAEIDSQLNGIQLN